MTTTALPADGATTATTATTVRAPRRWRFIGRRLGFYLVALWSAVTLNFLLPRLMPGDAALGIIERLERVSGQQVSPSAVESIQRLFGDPDANLVRQYFAYLGQIFRLDLGISVQSFPTPVADLLAQSLPWTVGLVGATTVLAFVLGTGLGVVAGWRAGSRFDAVVSPLTTFLSSVPYFWVALIALWAFGFLLGWFPLSGGYDPNTTGGLPYVLSMLRYGALPAATIVFSAFGGWLLGMRNMMVTTVREDYVLLAKAKGLPPRRVMLRYAARNAILPNFTGFALALGGVLGGALLTEIVFSYPGMGYLLYSALNQRDYPVMQGAFLLITIAVLVANLLADSVYALLDPRIREGR